MGQPRPASLHLAPITAIRYFLVEGAGFEPAYSVRTDLQSVAFNHSATPPNEPGIMLILLQRVKPHEQELVPDVGIEPTTF